MMWPSARLQTDHHYVVAMKELVDTDGHLIQPSDAFLALRWGIYLMYNDCFHNAVDVISCLEIASYPVMAIASLIATLVGSKLPYIFVLVFHE